MQFVMLNTLQCNAKKSQKFLEKNVTKKIPIYKPVNYAHTPIFAYTVALKTSLKLSFLWLTNPAFSFLPCTALPPLLLKFRQVPQSRSYFPFFTPYTNVVWHYECWCHPIHSKDGKSRQKNKLESTWSKPKESGNQRRTETNRTNPMSGKQYAGYLE